jgi:hypothetical protein
MGAPQSIIDTMTHLVQTAILGRLLFINKRDRLERLSSRVADHHTKQNAIASGSVVDWGHEVEAAFDFIVFLYVDTEVRVE